MSALLEIVGLTKTYGTNEVLRGIDISVNPGEVVGFVGPNGAGKTTCLRCITGLARRTGGRIAVNGLDPDTDGLAVRKHLSYLPGETSLYLHMTGQEVLAFATAFHPRQQDELVARMADSFALPLKHKVRKYSAGMKQKLAILAAIAPDVDLYLLDEPDRALDATTRYVLRELVFELRERGKGVFLSSHHLAEIENLAHRLVFLVQGQVIPDERIEEARRELRHRLRLKVRPGAVLPADHEVLHEDPDGTLVLETREDPVAWLQHLPGEDILAAEVGLTRLEDLYKKLSAVAEEPR